MSSPSPGACSQLWKAALQGFSRHVSSQPGDGVSAEFPASPPAHLLLPGSAGTGAGGAVCYARHSASWTLPLRSVLGWHVGVGGHESEQGVLLWGRSVDSRADFMARGCGEGCLDQHLPRLRVGGKRLCSGASGLDQVTGWTVGAGGPPEGQGQVTVGHPIPGPEPEAPLLPEQMRRPTFAQVFFLRQACRSSCRPGSLLVWVGFELLSIIGGAEGPATQSGEQTWTARPSPSPPPALRCSVGACERCVTLPPAEGALANPVQTPRLAPGLPELLG